MSGAQQSQAFPSPSRRKTRGNSRVIEPSGFYGTMTIPLNPLLDKVLTIPKQDRLQTSSPIVKQVIRDPQSQRSRTRPMNGKNSPEMNRRKSTSVMSNPQRNKQLSFLQKDVLDLRQANAQLLVTEQLQLRQSQNLEEFSRQYQLNSSSNSLNSSENSSENLKSGSLNSHSSVEEELSSTEMTNSGDLSLESLPSAKQLQEQDITNEGVVMMSPIEDPEDFNEINTVDAIQARLGPVQEVVADSDVANKKEDGVEQDGKEVKTRKSIKYSSVAVPCLVRKRQAVSDLSGVIPSLPLIAESTDFDEQYNSFLELLPPVSLATSSSTHELVISRATANDVKKHKHDSNQLTTSLNLLPDFNLSMPQYEHNERLQHAVDSYTHLLSQHMSMFVKRSVLHFTQTQLSKLQENKRKLHETLRWYHEHEGVQKDLCAELNNYEEVRLFYEDEVDKTENAIDVQRREHIEQEIRDAAAREEQNMAKKYAGDNMDYLKKKLTVKKAELESCLQVFHSTRGSQQRARERLQEAKSEYDGKLQWIRESVREEMDMLTEEGMLIQQTRAQNKSSLHSAERRVTALTGTRSRLSECLAQLTQLRLQCEELDNEKKNTIKHVQKLRSEINEKSSQTVRKIQEQCSEALRLASKGSKDAQMSLQTSQTQLLSALHCAVCKEAQPYGNIVLKTKEVVCTDCMGYYLQHMVSADSKGDDEYNADSNSNDSMNVENMYLHIYLSQPPPPELLTPEPLDEDVEWSMAAARADPDDPVAMAAAIERIQQERVDLLLSNYKPTVPKALALPLFKEAKGLYDSFQQEARDLLVSCQMTPMIMESYIASIQAVVANPDVISAENKD